MSELYNFVIQSAHRFFISHHVEKFEVSANSFVLGVAIINSIYCEVVLKSKQVICLEKVFLNLDILAVLPTGYSKSLVFLSASRTSVCEETWCFKKQSKHNINYSGCFTFKRADAKPNLTIGFKWNSGNCSRHQIVRG